MASQEAARLVAEQARALINSGLFGGALVQRLGRIETPRPVLTPEGGHHSWFVAVTVQDRLAGFIELTPDLTPMRYSSLQRKPESLDGCPKADSWLHPDRIRASAAARARPGETVGEPFLTYDRSPSRLVWAVRLSNAQGLERTVYVAGSEVYSPPPAGEPTIG